MEESKMTETQLLLNSIGKHLPIAIFINFLLVIIAKEWLGSPWWFLPLALIGYAGFEYVQKKRGGNNTLKHQTMTVGICLFSYMIQAFLISPKYF